MQDVCVWPCRTGQSYLHLAVYYWTFTETPCSIEDVPRTVNYSRTIGFGIGVRTCGE